MSVRVVPTGGSTSPLTTKGDIYGYDTAGNRIPVGSNDQVLTADSTQALGVKWADINGMLAWSEVTGTTQAAAIDTGYITNNAGLVTVTLPTTAALGSVIRIAGKGAGGWKLAQNASQLINFLGVATTTGTGGYLASSTRYDSVEILCITADTTWVVISNEGNLSYV